MSLILSVVLERSCDRFCARLSAFVIAVLRCGKMEDEFWFPIELDDVTVLLCFFCGVGRPRMEGARTCEMNIHKI